MLLSFLSNLTVSVLQVGHVAVRSGFVVATWSSRAAPGEQCASTWHQEARLDFTFCFYMNGEVVRVRERERLWERTNN